MFGHAPRTLWRFLFADVGKVALLTAGVLVVMMAFAAAVKPLADGKLEADQALKFMALALAPMLQFALPFAAGFGATLAYHRFAAENEAVAAHAGGVSHRALLAPALAIGLGFALLLAWLTHEAIPSYLRSMQRMVVQDVGRMITTSIENGRALRLPGGLIVHADSVARPPRDPASRAQDHLALSGVVAVRVDADGKVESEATARRAGVWLFSDAPTDERAIGGGTVVVRLIDASGALTGEAQGRSRDTEFRLNVPDSFRDDPKFYSWRGLLALRDNPDRISGVDARRRALSLALTTAALEREALASVRADGRLALADAEGQTLTVRVADMTREGDRWRLTPAREGKPIDLAWRLSGDRARMQSAARATLEVETPDALEAPGGGAPLISLELEDVATLDTASEVGSPTVRTRQRVGPFRLIGAPAPEPGTAPESSAALLERAARAPADDRVSLAAGRLRDEIDDLRREILSKEHERLAASASCVVMTLLGAVVALRRREGRPLVVYIWAFFPSLLALISIAGGQSLTHNEGAPGLLLLWGGVAALGVATLVEFVALRRR